MVDHSNIHTRTATADRYGPPDSPERYTRIWGRYNDQVRYGSRKTRSRSEITAVWQELVELGSQIAAARWELDVTAEARLQRIEQRRRGAA